NSIVHNWIKGEHTSVLQPDGNWKLEKGVVKDYLKLIKGKEKAFDVFLVARRVVEQNNTLNELKNEKAELEGNESPEAIEALAELNKQIAQIETVLKNDDFNLQDAVSVVEKFEPQFKGAIRIYDNINKRLVDFAENSGLISSEVADKYRSEKGYASFSRLINDELSGASIGTYGSGNSQSKARSFKQRTGGTQDIISPTFNQMTAINEMIGKSMENVMWNKVYDLSLKNTEIARRFEQIETVTAVDEKGNISFPQDKDPNLLKIFKNGKRIYIKAAPEFIAVAKTLRGAEWDLFTKIIQVPSAIFTRLTTSANPLFALGNITIDQITAVAQTKAGFRPIIDPAKSLVEYIKEQVGLSDAESALFKKYLEIGGKRQTFAKQYEVAPEEIINRIEEKTKVQKALHIIDSGLNILEFPSNMSEYMTRFAEFKRAKELGKSDSEAMFAASEVTTPFQLSGNWGGRIGQAWVKSMPYFNAIMEVSYKYGRAWKDSPQRMATVTGAVISTALTSAIMMMKFSDDEDKRLLAEQPARELARALFFPNPLGKGLIRIRIPEQMGAVTGLIYLYVIQNYKRNKASFDDHLNV
ncbi:MAG: hypothetical protein AAB875_00545, partial [Patescibacteria group bacterium]